MIFFSLKARVLNECPAGRVAERALLRKQRSEIRESGFHANISVGVEDIAEALRCWSDVEPQRKSQLVREVITRLQM